MQQKVEVGEERIGLDRGGERGDEQFLRWIAERRGVAPLLSVMEAENGRETEEEVCVRVCVCVTDGVYLHSSP